MARKSRRSPRADFESLVLRKKANGASIRGIASALGVSEWQVRCILRKDVTRKGRGQPRNKVRLKKVTKSKTGVTRAIVLSDIHIPEHDQAALAIALAYTKDFKPHIIVLNGDIMDMVAPSRFAKDPDDLTTLADEFQETKDFLTGLRKDHPDAEIIYTAGNHECFDDKTEVLTNRGWVHFSELSECDEVASYNMSTGQVEYSVPNARQSLEYTGDMHLVDCEGINFCVTPNHRVVYKQFNSRDKRYGPLKVDFAKDLGFSNGQRLTFPVAGVGCSQDYEDVDDDMLSLCGWLLTDSYLSKDGNKVVIYQSGNKHNMVKGALDKCGIRYTMSSRDRDIKQICGVALKNKPKTQYAFSVCAEDARKLTKLVPTNRVMPEWAYRLSARQARILLGSLIDGDGSRHKAYPETSWMLYGRKSLLDDVQRMCVSNGFRATLSTYRDCQFRLNITSGVDRTVDRVGKSHHLIPYSGKVYCVTTHNGTVVVRREGKPVISGNCRIQKYLFDQAQALASLPELAIDRLLGLDELDIPFKDDTNHVVLGRIRTHHGSIVKKHSGDSARGHMLKEGVSTLIGHIHKLGVVYRTDANGVHVAIENGHLSRPDPDYAGRCPDWQCGFTEVQFDKTGHSMVRQHHILKGRLVVDGVVYTA